MRLAFTDAGNDPTSLTTRQAYDLLAQGFGPGFNGPLVVAVDMHGPADRATVDELRPRIGGRRARRRLRRTAPVQRVEHRRRHRRRPDDVPAVGRRPRQLVQTLRNDVIPPAVARHRRATRWSAGETAGGIDAANFLGHRLFLVIGAVLVLSLSSC